MIQETDQSPKTVYDEILGLEARIKKLSYMSAGASLLLDDGSEISIRKLTEDKNWRDREMRSIKIGEFTFIATPDSFVLDNRDFPVQIRIGKVSIPGRAKVIRDIPLGLPEQKAVLNWINSSIEQDKLTKPPIKINFPSKR